MENEAQRLLDEYESNGGFLSQSVRDALEIEAHNTRCEIAARRRRETEHGTD